MNKQKEENMQRNKDKKKLEDSLIENKTYTPVTKENFDNWLIKYYKETKRMSKLKQEQEARLSGRDVFIGLKNEKLGGAEEFEEEGDDGMVMMI